jgi:RNA polymerase primary sigma factor
LELAETMGLSLPSVRALLSVPGNLLSLEQPDEKEPDLLLKDLIPDLTLPSPAEELANLLASVQTLSERERQVLLLLSHGLSVAECGKEMGLSRVWVYQIQKAALEKIRHHLRSSH